MLRSPQNPLVSVVIPTHNRKVMLARLLKSIFANTYKHVEVIVVDDASSDGTSDLVKVNFPKIKLIRNRKNLFTAGSRNEGIKHAKGELIFFIDDDNTLDRKAIRIMENAFIEDPLLGEAGPLNYSFENKKKLLWAITKRNMLTSKTYQPRSLKEFGGKKKWVTCDVPNAFMVRAEVIKSKKIIFRKIFGIMYEESDFAYRIRNAGYKIVVLREAKIYHDIEKTTKDGKLQDYMYHFMEDIRRPYVFARNRLLFHKMYSAPFEFIFISTIGTWFFAAYYTYKIIFYKGVGKFSLFRRVALVGSYLKGIIDGYYLTLTNSRVQ